MSAADATDVTAPLVYPPRHAAEELTGCRLQVEDSEQRVVWVPLPQGASLAHLVVAIDTAAGQAAAQHLPSRDFALRTLALNAQLAGPLIPGSWYRVIGSVRSCGEQLILVTCEVYDAADTLCALGSVRFVVVSSPRKSGSALSPEMLDVSAVPASWDAALGLGADVTDSLDGLQVRTAAPQASTDNGASMVHGGVQMRALELAMRSALGIGPTGQPMLSDVAMVFHRPVPLGAETGIELHSGVRRQGRRAAVAHAGYVGPGQRLLSTAEGIFTAEDGTMV